MFEVECLPRRNSTPRNGSERRISRNRRHSSQFGANAKDSDVNDHDHDPSRDGTVFPRRRLLKDASLIAGGAIAVGVLGPELASAAPARVAAPTISLRQTSSTPVASPAVTPVDLATYAPVNLTAAELTTLQAALDRLIPNDDLGPGANRNRAFSSTSTAPSAASPRRIRRSISRDGCARHGCRHRRFRWTRRRQAG